MRLNRFLSQAGIASRRQADQLISLGQVKVNGQTVTEMGTQVDPARDKVEANGQVVVINNATIIYILNKPRGVITTAEDPEGRKTVLDFVPAEPRVFPCGRLDEDTQGLVILTNDGDLCYRLTHPKFEHQKEYVVKGTSKNPEASLAKIKRGVTLSDGPIKPDDLTPLKIGHDKLEFVVTIHEGRNRIVRRLCAAVGIEIQSLTRTRVGHYELGNLAPGEYRTVS